MYRTIEMTILRALYVAALLGRRARTREVVIARAAGEPTAHIEAWHAHNLSHMMDVHRALGHPPISTWEAMP